MSQHAKTERGALVRSAHAPMHCEVQLTKCRLEASSDPAEWRRWEERKKTERKKERLQIGEEQRVKKQHLWKIVEEKEARLIKRRRESSAEV